MELEQGIPIPDQRVRGRPKSEAAVLACQMQIGESIFCGEPSHYETVRWWIRRIGGKYTSRKVDHGWRIWRTA